MMKIVVFYDAQLSAHPEYVLNRWTVPVEMKPLAGLAAAGGDALHAYDYVVVLGANGPQSTELTNEMSSALWHYVAAGGTLYGENLACLDYPTSRLFGFQQDYPSVVRTSEKMRVAEGLLAEHAGVLLEWDGYFQKGFNFSSEVWLTCGHFYETHRAVHLGEERVGTPTLVSRTLGEGRAVYAAFSLLGSKDIIPYRPYALWGGVWAQLRQKVGLPLSEWEAPLRLAYHTPQEALAAVADWFLHSGILPQRDGSEGVYENVHSLTRRIRRDHRPDCHAHTALMCYLYSKHTGDTTWEARAHKLLEYLFCEGYQDMDPQSATYGFWKWFRYPGSKPGKVFTDDNAWVCLVLLYLYRQTGREQYKKRGLLTAQALLETQHANGLRPEQFDGDELRAHGRKWARQQQVNMNPHFQSITHAAYLQAYIVSGDDAYLDTAYRGTMYLLDHTGELQFMYSETSGYTRLLLALAILVRYRPEAKLYDAIASVIVYLRQHAHPLGAIAEADNPDPERYGKEDAGVFIHNGEGIADLLYTNNFLLMNLWELWKATQDETVHTMYENVRDFVSKVQLQSDNPRFNGGWMRAFDLNRGEYFGNNGDTGWGPYCMESGWTNALLGVGLLMEQLDISLF